MSGLLIVIILLWLFRHICAPRPRRRGTFLGPIMMGTLWRMGRGPGPGHFGGFGSPFRGGSARGFGGGRSFGGGFSRGGGGGFTRGGGGGRFR